MHTIPVRFSVGLLVEAGDGGGGAPVPSGCSRTSLVFFFTASAMWGKQQGGIFIRWRVIGLGLWVQIGTADEKKVLRCGRCFVDGGSGAREEDAKARIRAARPSHYLWPPGCSGRERRVRQTAIEAVSPPSLI